MVPVAGLNYVGSDYVSDGNVNDVVNKLDADTEYAAAPVSQIGVQSQINTAVGLLASQVSVNNALAAFIQTSYLTLQETPLILNSQVGAKGGIVPLGSNSVIPSQFVPSLGVGYVLGPFGPTATYTATTGAGPVKIADWNIGAPGVVFQPIVFMGVMAAASSGGRPVIEVRMSAGPATYINQTLVARGVGRNNWNDKQAITVLPAPSSAGHSGVAGSDYPTTFGVFLTAWLFDANSEQVSVNSNDIATASCWFMRTAQ